MKAKSTLVIVCLALAFLMTVGTTAAQAQSCCCYGEWIVGAPAYAGVAALVLTASIVTTPFTWFGCTSGNCGFSMWCNFPDIFPKCNH